MNQAVVSKKIIEIFWIAVYPFGQIGAWISSVNSYDCLLCLRFSNKIVNFNTRTQEVSNISIQVFKKNIFWIIVWIITYI